MDIEGHALELSMQQIYLRKPLTDPLTMTDITVVKQSVVDIDAISLTSTIVSEHGSDEEFPVERILAEKTMKHKGKRKKYYLILWEDYPLERSIWQLSGDIGDGVLEAWKERKSRESKGLDQPFDIAKFDKLLAKQAADKAARCQQRQAKRPRLEKTAKQAADKAARCQQRQAKRARLEKTVSPSHLEVDNRNLSVETIEEIEVEDSTRKIQGKNASRIFRLSPASRQASAVCFTGISSRERTNKMPGLWTLTVGRLLRAIKTGP
jgi:hypothetical protein